MKSNRSIFLKPSQWILLCMSIILSSVSYAKEMIYSIENKSPFAIKMKSTSSPEMVTDPTSVATANTKVTEDSPDLATGHLYQSSTNPDTVKTKESISLTLLYPDKTNQTLSFTSDFEQICYSQQQSQYILNVNQGKLSVNINCEDKPSQRTIRMTILFDR